MSRQEVLCMALWKDIGPCNSSSFAFPNELPSRGLNGIDWGKVEEGIMFCPRCMKWVSEGKEHFVQRPGQYR